MNLQFWFISFVGMKSQEVSVAGKTTINIELEEETIGLEEVVSIGYGVQKKSVVTGSISSVKSEDLMNQSISRAEQALQRTYFWSTGNSKFWSSRSWYEYPYSGLWIKTDLQNLFIS